MTQPFDPRHIEETAMTILRCLLIAVAGTLYGLTGAGAQQDQPFCLRDADGQLTCHFETMAQCQEALKKGPTRTGTCIPNPKTGR
jgi:Protein of unknown function (DUF3551)